ncbi:MAG: RnfABCDGE type electron transport complex subunit G [Gemmatimonadales bacterium]|jgi:electron transport complex protein RnfG|nr:MAG: RnfABCDGE type electron transport complex subunit G [Gemmatimonadales bacterium]
MSEKLPTVGGGEQPEAMEVAAQPGRGIPQKPQVSSGRLVATLAIAGAVAGFFIVLVHQWSQPRIQEYQARVLRDAVQEVLGAPDHTETWFLHDGAFTAAPPATADTAELDRIYVGFAADGSPVGVAASAAEPGFQDVIRLIFGYDPGESAVLGMKVLESKETPGLGDKIEKDSSFVAEFRGVEAPLVGVKPGRATGAENEVDMITGATISSEAIIDIINNRLDVLSDPLQRLWREGTATASSGGGTVPPAGGTASAAGTTAAVGGGGGTP